MVKEKRTAAGRSRTTMATAGSAIAVNNVRRCTLRRAYRRQIECLLDKSDDRPLTDAWKRVYPWPIGPHCPLPDRRKIIEDLTDFAEVLRPNLRGMQADHLCRLVEKYAACRAGT